MAITVYETPGREFSSDEKGYVSGSRKWKIYTPDALNASPLDIFTAVGVNKYDQHPQYPQAIARTPKLQQSEGDAVVWMLEIEYSSAPFEASQQPGDSTKQSPSSDNNQLKAPDLRPPVWSFTRKEIQKVLEFDAVTTNPVVNSAGFPFDPPIEVPRSNMLIRLDFWVTYIDNAILRNRWDRVNDGVWQGFPPRTLRVNDFNAKSHYEKADGGGLLAYWDCSLELEYSDTPWNPKKILDQGSVERVSELGVLRFRQVGDDSGNPIVVPLNGSGKRLDPGNPLVYLSFNAYAELNFTTAFF